jgi:hypothetical protein
MSDEVMTAGTETSVIVPEIWSKKYYDTLLAALPFNDVIDRSWEGEIKTLGDTVKISTIPEFDEGTELPEADRADAEALTLTQQSLVINKRIVKDFIVTNTALLQSLPFVDKVKELAVYSIMKKIQAVIIAAISPSASNPDHTIAYDSSTTLALADALEVKELLDAAVVPAPGRSVVLGAEQINDLFNITGFMSSDFVTADNQGGLITGEIPKMLLGFKPYLTTIVGDTSYWFHQTFFTMASQQGMNVAEFDLGVDGKRAKRINTDTLIGVKQLDNTRVVTLA